MVSTLNEVSDRRFRYLEVAIADLRRQNPEAAVMHEWFDRVGYQADIEALRRDYPEVGWQTFEEWARTRDWRIADSVMPAAE